MSFDDLADFVAKWFLLMLFVGVNALVIGAALMTWQDWRRGTDK